jgi:hypothetical protein
LKGVVCVRPCVEGGDVPRIDAGKVGERGELRVGSFERKVKALRAQVILEGSEGIVEKVGEKVG